MDYEKKLKDALDDKLVPVEVQEWIEETFPELVESEDERIRQFLIHEIEEASDSFMSYYNMSKKDILAWLEKQSKDSPVFSNSSNIGKVEQKPTFEMKTPEESLGIDSDTYSKIVDECVYGEQKPADKKGMNLVEEEMTPFQKKVFCIIDTTIEEEQGLKQVCDELLRLAHDEIIQNTAWSEEDRRMLVGLIDELDAIMNKATPNEISVYSKYTNWLKSLRPQNTWKPSDEQMNNK